MQMIVITNVEFVHVDRDPWEILTAGPTAKERHQWRGRMTKEITKELIHGRRFTRPSDGTDIVIGTSRQAQEILGLQYEAWELQAKAYAAEKRSHRRTVIELQGCQAILEDIRTASWVQRLKWLFFGCG